jgi:hypothetical protein
MLRQSAAAPLLKSGPLCRIMTDLKYRMLPRVGAEQAAKRRVRQDLAAFLRLARLAHAVSERAIILHTARPLDATAQVRAQLLVQSANQLRLVELAAERGYALQALGAASTLYEHVSVIGYIDAAEKAEEWQAHTDFKETFPPAKKRATGIRFMLASTGVPASQIEALVATWEDHYTRFCAAKHGNPTLLSKYAVTRFPKEVTLHLGPIGGPAYTLFSRIALFHGSRLLADASVLFAFPLLGLPKAASFRRARRTFLSFLDTIAQKPALAQFE